MACLPNRFETEGTNAKSINRSARLMLFVGCQSNQKLVLAAVPSTPLAPEPD